MTLEVWRKVLHRARDRRIQAKRRSTLDPGPTRTYRIIFLVDVFTYPQGSTDLTFLYGNLRDVDLVYNAVQRRPARRHGHARRFLADLRKTCLAPAAASTTR